MSNRRIVIAVVLTLLAVLATATATYRLGYEQGFDGCIEENNLYDRYNKGE